MSASQLIHQSKQEGTSKLGSVKFQIEVIYDQPRLLWRVLILPLCLLRINYNIHRASAVAKLH